MTTAPPHATVLDSLQTLSSIIIYALSMYLLTFINFLRHNGNINLARSRYCLSFLFTIELLEMIVGQGYHNRR